MVEALNAWADCRGVEGNFFGLIDDQDRALQFYFVDGIPDDVEDARHLRIVLLDFPLPERGGSYSKLVTIGETSELIKTAFRVGADYNYYEGLDFSLWDSLSGTAAPSTDAEKDGVELPDGINDELEELSAQGDEFAQEQRYEEAQECFVRALRLLPEPISGWDAGLWLLVSIGDMQFLRKLFQDGRQTLMQAMKEFDDARSNPFVRLRLGQCMLELGEKKEALNWLSGAYLMEGLRLFENEDPKYINAVKSELDPPPGGWPAGW